MTANAMKAPRIVRELKPVTGPAVSRIERDGTAIIVRAGGTLPPVSLISGSELPLKEAVYELTWLPVKDDTAPPQLLTAALGVHGAGSRTRPGARASVRLPYGKGEFAARRKRRLGFIAIVAALAVGAVLIWGLPSSHEGRSTMLGLGGIVLFTGVLMALHHKSNCSGEILPDGRIRLSGLSGTVIDKMLLWQEQHPDIYSPNT